jgi:SAM-dependent methyltransferase
MYALEERTAAGLHAALQSPVTSLGLAADARILDIACGTRAWLKRLHAMGYRELWGTDRDVDGFQASDIAHFVPADFDSESRLPTDFSLVTMIEIIEHVENPYRLVEMAANALAPGGWLLITSPNIYSLRAQVRFLIRPRLPFFEHSPSSSIEEDHIHPVVMGRISARFLIVRIYRSNESGLIRRREAAAGDCLLDW